MSGRRVVAILQARMGSTRLPGKVLADIAGVPMLVRTVERARRAATIDDLIVATTREPADDALDVLCRARGYRIFRGSTDDVLDRTYRAAVESGADVIVRWTADCPLLDPDLVDLTVRTFLDASPPADLVVNRLPGARTYPIGLDTEVCTFQALEMAWKEAAETFHREHVMPYLYEGVELKAVNGQLSTGISQRGFKIAQLHHNSDYGAYRWTVDTPEDLEFMRQVYARFDGSDDFSWKDVLELVHDEPDLIKINQGVKHKTLKDIDQRAAR